MERGETVRINVGGVVFKCYAKTLQRFQGSLLAQLDRDNEHYDANENEYFFDRNPMIFQFILDSYRTGSLHIPGDMCSSKFKEELEFWGLSEFLVSRCCWEALYRSEEKIQTIEALEHLYGNTSFNDDAETKQTVRHKIWIFLHEPKSSRYAMIWSVYISVIIALSVVVSAVETVSQARTGTYTEAENATFHRALMFFQDTSGPTKHSTFFDNFYKKPHVLITVADSFCFVVLTVELVLVFCFCTNRSGLFKCWLHMSEVICSIAFWFYFFCERNLDKIESMHIVRAMVVCKYLTILKLVRLFRIARHIPALKIMGLTIWLSKYELYVLGIMLFILTSSFGILVYVSECTDNDTFDNVFVGMYWALITMTTVGYGSYVPNTATGHVVASACAICGVIILALPIGIFASNFNNLYHHHQYVYKHIESSQKSSAEQDKKEISSNVSRANVTKVKCDSYQEKHL